MQDEVYLLGGFQAINLYSFFRIVTGTYKHREGVYYGGNKIEKSHEILSNFLKGFVRENGLDEFIVIDIHTGILILTNGCVSLMVYIKKALGSS